MLTFFFWLLAFFMPWDDPAQDLRQPDPPAIQQNQGGGYYQPACCSDPWPPPPCPPYCDGNGGG